jgi:4-amino-4-deoxy-L-arabinose transferase-like glycosyltransferase
MSRRTTGLLLLAITLVGLAIRLIAWDQPVLGDELSTLWIVREFDLAGTIREVSSDAEISPPLYFVLAWLASKLGSAPELVRLPALIAGVAAIPLSYLLGTRIRGRVAGLIAAAAMALSPFMVAFSVNGRAYSLMIALLIGSTLAMLAAMKVDSGWRRPCWWALFGAFTCLAMYSHYTAVYFLGAQLIWLLIVSPNSRLPALAATAGAAVLYLPWVPSMIDDLNSPTLPILEAIQGTGLSERWLSIKQLLAGQPLLDPVWVPLVLLAAGAAVLAVGLLRRPRVTSPDPGPAAPTPNQGLWLLLSLTLATAICEGLLALAGTDTFGSRNLAATWAALPALIGALAAACPPALGLAASALLLAGFGAGTARVVDAETATLDFKAAADWIDRNAGPGDVVYDTTFVSPVPLTSLDAYLPQNRTEFRPRIPADEPPFLLAAGPTGQDQGELDDALAATGRNRLFVLTSRDPVGAGDEGDLFTAAEGAELPGGWKIVETKTFPGRLPLTVTELQRR